MSIYVKDADGNRKKVAGIGLPGPTGKSAYQYAVEGGFSGTEDEFKALIGVRSNTNLLDNGNFADPVNQKGKEEYTSIGYTIDRWHLDVESEAAKLQIMDGFVRGTKTNTAYQWGAIAQLVDPDLVKQLAGKTVTFSVLQRGTGISNITLWNNDILSPVAVGGGNPSTDWTLNVVTATLPDNLNSLRCILYFDVGEDSTGYTDFLVAKLELGPVQTLAHQDAGGNWVLNDPPPNKALELAKCQRYMLVLSSSGTYGGVAYGAYDPNYKYLQINFPTPVTMRADPSVTCTGVWYVRGGGVTKTINTSDMASSGGVHENIVAVFINAQSIGLPSSDQAYVLMSSEDPQSKIILDANL